MFMQVNMIHRTRIKKSQFNA